jgi:hypothetical protein
VSSGNTKSNSTEDSSSINQSAGGVSTINNSKNLISRGQTCWTHELVYKRNTLGFRFNYTVKKQARVRNGTRSLSFTRRQTSRLLAETETLTQLITVQIRHWFFEIKPRRVSTVCVAPKHQSIAFGEENIFKQIDAVLEESWRKSLDLDAWKQQICCEQHAQCASFVNW